MAKLNMVIKAFDAEELQMLAVWAEAATRTAAEDGYLLSNQFHELKETIQLASKYSSGLHRDKSL